MSTLKKIGKWVGIGFGCLLVLTVVLNVVDPEGMKKVREEQARAAEERAAQRQADKKKADTPSGATIAGGMVAMDMAKSGALKPTSTQVDALARKAATKMDVPQGDRARFVRDFEHGFWVGWKTATQ